MYNINISWPITICSSIEDIWLWNIYLECLHNNQLDRFIHDVLSNIVNVF